MGLVSSRIMWGAYWGGGLSSWLELSVTGSGVSTLGGGSGASSGRSSLLVTVRVCCYATHRTDAGVVMGSFFTIGGTAI